MKNTTDKLAATAKRIVPALSGFDPAEILAADKATRTLAQIEKHPLVSSISDERGYGDGIWVYLKDGFINANTDTASIHEDTVAECLALLKTAWFDIRDTESEIFAEARAAAKGAQNEDEANAIALRVLAEAAVVKAEKDHGWDSIQAADARSAYQAARNSAK